VSYTQKCNWYAMIIKRCYMSVSLCVSFWNFTNYKCYL